MSKLYGKIVSFDRNTCVGEVQYDLTVMRFHSTSFQGNFNGWPRVGQRVEIVLTKSGELCSLHADEGNR
jgi:hypothetical protein